jgi:uncharacterized protein YjeT (DUF2065 family)
MKDFVVAFGLVFVIEGLLFAAFPAAAKRGLSAMLDTPPSTLRIIGLGGAVIGVGLVWLVRH